MRVVCDYCGTAASGLREDLLDKGWCMVEVSEPIEGTFVSCPKHSGAAGRAAVAAILIAMEKKGARPAMIDTIKKVLQ